MVLSALIAAASAALLKTLLAPTPLSGSTTPLSSTGNFVCSRNHSRSFHVSEASSIDAA